MLFEIWLGIVTIFIMVVVWKVVPDEADRLPKTIPDEADRLPDEGTIDDELDDIRAALDRADEYDISLQLRVVELEQKVEGLMASSVLKEIF